MDIFERGADMQNEVEPIQESYGENKLVLLIRDPGCLFAYWELTQELRSMVEQHFRIPWGQVQLLARVMGNLNEPGQSLSILNETAIDKLADNWYFPVESGRRFQVILGLRGPGGDFIPLLESNLVELGDNPELLAAIPRKQAEDRTEKSPPIPAPSGDYEYPLGISSASHLPK